MIKQNLWVSKARIPITNTPPNQLAKAILHSFSWSFKTLSHPCLKLLYFYCSPVSWDHLEGRPGVPSLLWGVSRNLWCKCWCISSDAGHTKRISQRGESRVYILWASLVFWKPLPASLLWDFSTVAGDFHIYFYFAAHLQRNLEHKFC